MMKKILIASLILFLLLVLVSLFSCGDKRYEELEGYIKEGAEVEVNFTEKEAYVPEAYIDVVVNNMVVKAKANVISQYPGRTLVFFHHKHPLGNTKRISVKLNHDKLKGEYMIYSAVIAE